MNIGSSVPRFSVNRFSKIFVVAIFILVVVVAEVICSHSRFMDAVFLVSIPLVSFAISYSGAYWWPAFFSKVYNDNVDMKFLKNMIVELAMNYTFVAVFVLLSVMFFQWAFVHKNLEVLMLFGRIIIGVSFMLIPMQGIVIWLESLKKQGKNDH